MPAPLMLGMILMPEFIQCEGLEQVLHNCLDVAGATDMTTVASVMGSADEAHGEREPPSDGGAGDKRVLDRPLWGKHWLYSRTAPSFEPDHSLYADTPYDPPRPTELTMREGHVVGDFLNACRQRGVRTWLQVMAAAPPGIRVQFGGPCFQDCAVAADAREIGRRVDRNGSMANGAIRHFLSALLRDLARAYPQADGFRLDWPEYAPYDFDTLFFDYSPDAMALGTRLGFDVEAIRTGMRRIAERIPALARPGALASLTVMLNRADLATLLTQHPVIGQHLAFRAAIVADFIAFVGSVTKALGKQLFLQGFPPPWNLLSGFDPAFNSTVADGVGVKAYTMHWPMIARNYYDALITRGAPAGTDLAALIVRALAIAPPPSSPEALRYPDPDESHPADSAAIAAKMESARTAIRGAEFWGITHAYGPDADMMRRFRAVAGASGGRVYLNRYGYLNDNKLRMVGEFVRGAR